MGEYADDAIDAGMDEAGYNGFPFYNHRLKASHPSSKPAPEPLLGVDYHDCKKWLEKHPEGWGMFDLCAVAWAEGATRMAKLAGKPTPESVSNDEYTWWWDALSEDPARPDDGFALVWLAWKEAVQRVSAS